MASSLEIDPTDSRQQNIVRQGWLTKSRNTLKFPNFFLRRRWAKRYFVLCAGDFPAQYKLLQYKNEKKQKILKTFDLDKCSRVDSYLKIDDYQWIFAIHLSKSNDNPIELYLVADSDATMNAWVSELCNVCNLERDEIDETHQQQRDDGTDYAGPSPEEERMYRLDFPPIDGGSSRVVTSNDSLSSNVHDYLLINEFSSNNPSQPIRQGYVHLKDMISAEPRPNRSGSMTTNGCSSGVMTLPIAPLAPPLDSIHHRATSSDSTTSSHRSISLSDHETESSSQSTTPSRHNLPPIVGGTLDVVVPPPPSSVGHRTPSSYPNEQTFQFPIVHDSSAANVLNQRPPAPDPINDDLAGSSAETIKCPADEVDHMEYINTTLPYSVGTIKPSVSGGVPTDSITSPPMVDRTKKPRNRRTEVDDDNTPPHSQSVIRLNRISSFVKKNASLSAESSPQMLSTINCERPKVPALLPKTSPRHTTGIRSARSPPSPPISRAHINQQQQLEYVDPSFTQTIRTPSPRFIHNDTNSITSSSSSRVNYLQIDDKLTQAIGRTNEQKQEESRTLERKKQH